MRTDPLPTVALPRGSFLRLDAGPGWRVECVRGTLWLTLDRDPRDIVLAAGDGFTLDRPGPALLGSLADSELLMLRRGQP